LLSDCFRHCSISVFFLSLFPKISIYIAHESCCYNKTKKVINSAKCTFKIHNEIMFDRPTLDDVWLTKSEFYRKYDQQCDTRYGGRAFESARNFRCVRFVCNYAIFYWLSSIVANDVRQTCACACNCVARNIYMYVCMYDI
jgi:hypothetical protein